MQTNTSQIFSSESETDPNADRVQERRDVFYYFHRRLMAENFSFDAMAANWGKLGNQRFKAKEIAIIFTALSSVMDRLSPQARDDVAEFFLPPDMFEPLLCTLDYRTATLRQLSQMAEFFNKLDIQNTDVPRAIVKEAKFKMHSRDVLDAGERKKWVRDSTRILHAASRLDGPVADLFFEKYQKTVSPHLRIASTYDLTNLLSALETLPPPHPAFMQNFLSTLESNLTEYRPASLFHILGSFNEMKFDPGHRFMREWQDAVAESDYPRVPYQMALNLFHIGSLGHVPVRNFMEKCIRYTATNIERFDGKDLSFTLKALGMFSQQSRNREYAEVAHFLMGRLAACEDISREQLRTLHDASLWFDQPEFNQGLIKETDKRPQWKTHLKAVFARAGANIRPAHDAHIFEINHRVDIIMDRAGEPVFIEADGPDRFNRDIEGRLAFNGQTRFRSALMRKICPAVPLVRICFEHCMDDGGPRRDMGRLVAAFEKLEPGTYRTDIVNNNSRSISIVPMLDRAAPL